MELERHIQRLADGHRSGDRSPSGTTAPHDSQSPAPTQPISRNRLYGNQFPDKTTEEQFIARLAVSLHQYGTPSHELEEILQTCAQKLNLEAAFFSTPTAIFISFPQSIANRTVLQRVSPGEIDLEKLVEVNKALNQFLDEKLSIEESTAMLDRIAMHKSSFSNLTYTAAFAFGSGAVVSFFGGGVPEMIATALIGLLVGGLEIIARKNQNFARAYSAVAAISASFLAVVASTLYAGLSSEIVTLCGLIVLVPGLTITMAVSELSRQHLASGTSRFMGAILQFMILTFGVSFGRGIALQIFSPQVSDLGDPAPWIYWACVLLSPIAFSVLFRTRKKDVPLVALTCIIGFLAGRLGVSILGSELGPAFGSFSLCVFSNLVSRRFRHPTELTLVPGLMFLVPGSIGFLGLQSFVNRETLAGIQSGFTVLFVSSALVIGLLLANVLVPPRKWESE